MSTRVVHYRDRVPGAVYIGRAMPRMGLKASPFANPFKITPTTSRQTAITRYEEHLVKNPHLWALLPDLRDKPLACWCRYGGDIVRPDNACHGDVLVKLLNAYTDEELRALSEGGAE